MRLVVSVVLLLALVVSHPSITVAQDASPAATPTAACLAPELPPGTPTPMEASPAAMEAMDAASPAPEDIGDGPAGDASPEAQGTPAPSEGESASQADVDRVTATFESAYACLNSGDYLGFAAHSTSEALLEEFGTANPYDVPAILGSFAPPPFQLVSVERVLVLPDGRLYAEAVYRFGNALTKEGIFFVERDGDLLADAGAVDLPVDVPADAQVADVAMVDYAFELSQTSFTAGAPIAFNVANEGEYPHEFVLVQFPEGVTAEQVLEDFSLIEQVTFVGATFAEPGQAAPPLVLLDLAPGTYTVVCFVDVPEGVPHVARGMVAEITIQ